MKTEVSISERLKDLRVEKKLNLEELAELTGISKSALGSYELDTPREMNHKNLIALAGFYEVSVDYLLGQTENRSSTIASPKRAVVGASFERRDGGASEKRPHQ